MAHSLEGRFPMMLNHFKNFVMSISSGAEAGSPTLPQKNTLSNYLIIGFTVVPSFMFINGSLTTSILFSKLSTITSSPWYEIENL